MMSGLKGLAMLEIRGASGAGMLSCGARKRKERWGDVDWGSSR